MNMFMQCWKTVHQLHHLSACRSQTLSSTCFGKSIGWTIRNFSSNLTEELDENERALKELDVKLLKPHPEWRNVAAGPVWGKGNEYFELLWKPFLDESFVEKYQKIHDQEWEDYIQKFGETPVEYLSTKDYKELYAENDTWVNYRRNIKGFIPRQRNRKTCMRKGVIASGSPCPLCRDERLLMTYKNLPLLKQYIDHQTGELHNPLRTALCRVKHQRLVWSFTVAKDLGYLPQKVPFVKFNLNDFKINHYVS